MNSKQQLPQPRLSALVSGIVLVCSMLCLPAIIGHTANQENAPTDLPTGIYSDLGCDQDSGDSYGLRVEFVRTRAGYQAILLLSEGGPCPQFYLMDVRREGDAVVLRSEDGKRVIRGKLTPYAFTVSEGAFTQRAILKKFYETEASGYVGRQSDQIDSGKYSDWHYTDDRGAVKGTTVRLFWIWDESRQGFKIIPVVQIADGTPGRMIVGSVATNEKETLTFNVPKTKDHGVGRFQGKISLFELRGRLTLDGAGSTTVSLARVGDY